MKKPLSLKLKLVLSFSLASLVGFSFLGIANYIFAGNLLRSLIEEKLQEQIAGAENTIKFSFEDNIRRHQKLMNFWSAEILPKMKIDRHDGNGAPSLIYEGKNIEDHNFVDQLSQRTGDAVTLFVKTNEGLMRISTSVRKADGTRATGTMIPKESAVYKEISEGRRYVGRSEVVGKWYTAAYEPIMHGQEVVGAFFLGAEEESSQKIKEHLKAQKIFKTGYYFILDGEGQMVLHPSKEGENMLGQADLDGRLIFKDIIERKSGIINYHWLNAQTKLKQDKMAVFKYIPEMNWYLAASLNKEEAEEALGILKWTSFSITLAFVFVMIALSFWFGSRISNSLQILSNKLNLITQETNRGSTDLSDSAQSLASSATEAASSLEETVASLEEINSQVQNNLKITEETNLIGRKTLKSAEVSEARLKSLSQFMAEIEQDSKKIREISTLIDDIAFQTNLLSLNAAVEAARAGEHGKGFAVVAEAVRSLASRSADSARLITSTITESGERIQKVVQAGHDAESSFHEIMKSVQHLSELITNITTASEEQASGLSQINLAMNQLDSTTQGNSQLSEGISEASGKLSEHTRELRYAVQSLNHLITGQDSLTSNETSSSAKVLDFKKSA